MIWFITLLLLAIAAWLLLNAFNEKQWVDAHIHDENVAKDEGLFTSFSGLTQSDDNPEADKLTNVVSNVRKKTAEAGGKLGERLNEAKHSDAAEKMLDKTSGIRSRIKSEMTEETGLLNKIKTNVSAGVEKASQKVDEKIVNRKS